MIVSNETIVKEWLDVKRPAGFDLESFLPYRLSVTTNRVSRAFAALYEQEFGISIPEWRAIAVLGAFAPLSLERDLRAHRDGQGQGQPRRRDAC